MWQMLGTDKFAKVIDFLRRQIHRETVFVYINSAFSPNPDELVIDLFNDDLLLFCSLCLSVKQVTFAYQHTTSFKISALMVNCWSTMPVQWRGANFHEQLCRYTVHTISCKSST
ncbi:hypothetical protein NC653_001864 [Populus alba x Populus x berolinensis]|uniref:Ubiquitin-like protein ATG12 n=1 Tax=Populus alba x Populus x berolinensis TaxID=444605 RepID=A0AAD6RMA4_9ROSI|nr:hypothetical protein NC653_001864 [Populus alba x Populus x berolinensis]